MDIQSMKDALEGTLNSTALSTDSIYGILIIIVIAYLIIRGIRHVTSSIGSIVGFVLFLEICHILAFNTSVGTWFPAAQDIFKYDVFTALAQLCVGTPVADFLLWTQAWLNTVCLTVVKYVMYFMQQWTNYAKTSS